MNRNGKDKIVSVELIDRMVWRLEFVYGLVTDIWESVDKIPTDSKATRLKFSLVKCVHISNWPFTPKVKIRIILPFTERGSQNP